MSHYQNFEPPFEIPDSWEWVTVGDILENRDAERVPVSSAIRKKQTNKIYDYYGAAGVIDKVDSFLFKERLLLVGEDGANLLSRNKDNAFFAEGKFWVNNHAHILDCHIKCVLDYVAVVINSYSLEPYITGSAQPKLSQDNLMKIPIPLPPLAEQQRILKTIEDTIKNVDTINSNTTVLEDLISFTKSKILELAMTGKLVPQDPTDEPASEMLKRINPNAKIITDNPHYPSKWVPCKVGDLLTVVSGVSYGKDDIMSNSMDSIRILRGGNIKCGKLCLLEDDVFVSEKCAGNNNIKKGDTIMVASTGSMLAIGKTAYISEIYQDIYIGAFLRILRPKDLNLSQYLGLFFQSSEYKDSIQQLAKGSNINNIKASYITEMIIGLPPLNEQKRIVAKVEELYSVLNEIETSLQS